MSNKIINLFGNEDQIEKEVVTKVTEGYSLSDERLCNLVIFVMLDQQAIADQALQLLIEKGEDGSERAKYVNALIDMRDHSKFSKYLNEISLWVERHIKYIKNPLEVFDKRYYTLIQDALFIIYCDDYNKGGITGSQYAVLCEQKYSVDWKE